MKQVSMVYMYQSVVSGYLPQHCLKLLNTVRPCLRKCFFLFVHECTASQKTKVGTSHPLTAERHCFKILQAKLCRPLAAMTKCHVFVAWIIYWNKQMSPPQ